MILFSRLFKTEILAKGYKIRLSLKRCNDMFGNCEKQLKGLKSKPHQSLDLSDHSDYLENLTKTFIVAEERGSDHSEDSRPDTGNKVYGITQNQAQPG